MQDMRGLQPGCLRSALLCYSHTGILSAWRPALHAGFLHISMPVIQGSLFRSARQAALETLRAQSLQRQRSSTWTRMTPGSETPALQ